MRNYWTCSKFADWLRGTAKPSAETGKGWRKWRQKAQYAHPFRYWLADVALDTLQDVVMWIPDKLYNLKYYINNRWVTRTHSLTAHPRDIKPGTWCDVGDRFLPCLFNELVDFVEIELAWWNIAWADKDARAKYKAPFWAAGWFRWRTWRCKESGLDNLKWQMSLDNKEWTNETNPEYGNPSPQAINAKEIYDLYIWWTEERPKRVDPMEASGWGAYCVSRWNNGQGILDDLDDLEKDNGIDTKPMHDMMNKLEAKYEKEDEEMLIRLIKVRKALWT